jgi:hypothetical protein
VISAVGIFCIGAGASIFNGVGAIMDPAAHGGEHLFWGIAVLLFSTLIEGFSLYVAVSQRRGVGSGHVVLNFVKAGGPNLTAIMMETGLSACAAACTRFLADLGCMVMLAVTALSAVSAYWSRFWVEVCQITGITSSSRMSPKPVPG